MITVILNVKQELYTVLQKNLTKVFFRFKTCKKRASSILLHAYAWLSTVVQV